MQPPDETGLSAEENLGVWRRLMLGLILFLAWLPVYVRMFFLRGLQGHAGDGTT